MATRMTVVRVALGLVLAGGTSYVVPSLVDSAYAFGGCSITCAGGSCSGSDGYSCECATNGTPSCKPATKLDESAS